MQTKIKLSQILLLVGAVALIGLGIFLGNNKDIYLKAIFICMECIGIG